MTYKPLTDKQVYKMLEFAFDSGIRAASIFLPDAWESDIDFCRRETVHKIFGAAERGLFDD